MRAMNDAEFQRINELGDQLRNGFNAAFGAAGVRGQALGMGSLVNIVLDDEPMPDARATIDAMFAAGPATAALHLTMLRHGVASASRLMYCTSTAMDSAVVDFVVDALAASLEELKPVLEKELPRLCV